MTVRPPQMTTAVEKHAKGCYSPLWNAAPPLPGMLLLHLTLPLTRLGMPGCV